MNLGGEPERDDFGLPPVDIEIPDDARELDRDVQAYHREQRALRRQLRRARLHGPLTRDGMMLPLLAGCLVFALIAAVLLTFFTATSDGIGRSSLAPRKPPNTAPPAIAPSARTPTGSPATTTAPSGTAIVSTGGHLPDKTIEVRGRSVALRTLTASVLALVPQGCACTAALRQLIRQAAQARVNLYLVGTHASVARLRKIAVAAGRARPQVADDAKGVLSTAYPPSGLTAILVRADGAVALATRLRPGLQLRSEFRSLGQDASPGS